MAVSSYTKAAANVITCCDPANGLLKLAGRPRVFLLSTIVDNRTLPVKCVELGEPNYTTGLQEPYLPARQSIGL